ncbi:YybH family protein [Actinophytocola sp. NPDC049390]|uniref:YybH family protein n=1 Tax=Actinophytocola sp. NPDC049390 TaxID=3363894 RepID=UPI003792070D
MDRNEIEIRQHIGKIVEGIEAKDFDTLRRLYASDVVSFDVEPPLEHVGVEAKVRNWTNVFTIFQEATYELRELTVTVGGDVAFAHGFGRLSGTLRDGTTTNGMWVRATYGLRKTAEGWLIAHDQASVPFDIRTGRGVTDLEP